ncbi:MAG: hypothetical protein V4704_10815 [Pseudomonadota bacterium]
MSLPRVLLLAICAAVSASTSPAWAQAPAGREYRVLLVGNSLTYTNNLPALLRAVGASHGDRIVTETYAGPAATLSQHWKAGHVGNALRNRKFDVVVLQEMGGLVACLASASQQRKAPCAASVQAHVGLVQAATAAEAKTLLLSTWARDERSQARIDRGMRHLAKDTGATVFDAAGAVESLRQAHPDARPYPDGTHPSTMASLMMAVALYRQVTGTTPLARDLKVDAVLLPVNAAVSPGTAMESQGALAGTGKATLVPASLVAPLVKALPDPNASVEVDPSRRRR